ncbi:serine/threonine-protein kinase [Arthrobacter sp. SPG23]|uniref:serine/threonine-protein kinase n=1 Tax=Arthrobacter sp. SPG23 TaxID=1610703 RepID=UPI0009E34C41|nr:serine/threonine-protein kinase [Arthrobacter sp. SPG23]
MEKFEYDGAPVDGGPATFPAAAAPDAAGPGTRGADPEVPGYKVGRQLGRGSSASVWLVREELTLREFAVKCFEPSGPLAPEACAGYPARGSREAGDAEEAVRRELRIISALDHDHLVKAHDVVRLPGPADGGLGLVMDYAAGGSLAQLVTCRGPLGVGETVTVLTPLAQALGYLHGKGFTHSDVAPGNVLFTAHGKPLLADLGVTRMVGDAADVSSAGTDGFVDPAPVDALRAGLQPERDVYSAAAIGWYCLTGKAPEVGQDRPPLSLLVPGVPPALAAALEAGLKEDRRERPTALEFAAAVYRSADAAPVDLTGAVHPTVLPQLLTRRNVPPSHQARRAAKLRAWRRRLGGSGRSLKRKGRTPGRHAGGNRRWIGAAVAAIACSGIAAVWFLAGQQPAPWQAPGPEVIQVPSEPGAPSGTGAGPAPADARQLAHSQQPEVAARGLAALRSAALNSGQLELLDEVNLANSPAAAADAKISGRLKEAGHVLTGFDTTLTRAEAEPGGSDSRAVVAITVANSAYRETDAGGNVVAVEPAGPEQQLRLVLVSSGGRWRIQEILPAA